MSEAPDKALARIIDRELQHAQALAQLLEAEHQALDARDRDRIEQAALAKREEVEALETLEEERRGLLEAQGLEAGDMDTALARWGSGSVTEQWQSLVSIVAQCQHHNRTNGAVIDANQRRVREALGILRGDGIEQGTYGPNGHTQADHGSRTIDQA